MLVASKSLVINTNIFLSGRMSKYNNSDLVKPPNSTSPTQQTYTRNTTTPVPTTAPAHWQPPPSLPTSSPVAHFHPSVARLQQQHYPQPPTVAGQSHRSAPFSYSFVNKPGQQLHPPSHRMDGSTLLFNQFGGAPPHQLGYQDPLTPSTSSPLLFQPNIQTPTQQSQQYFPEHLVHDSYPTEDDNFPSFSKEFLHGDTTSTASSATHSTAQQDLAAVPDLAHSSSAPSSATMSTSSNFLWPSVMTPSRKSPMYTTMPFSMGGPVNTMSPTAGPGESPVLNLYTSDHSHTSASTSMMVSSPNATSTIAPSSIAQPATSYTTDSNMEPLVTQSASGTGSYYEPSLVTSNVFPSSNSSGISYQHFVASGHQRPPQAQAQAHQPVKNMANSNSQPSSPGSTISSSSASLKRRNVYKEGGSRVASGSDSQYKKFQCHICGKYFRRDLPRHLRTHQEVARFVCPYPQDTCPHKRGQFNRPYDFKKHLLHGHFVFDEQKTVRSFRDLHSKLPYMGTCICGMRFSADDWLNNHVLGGDQSCPFLVRSIGDNLQMMPRKEESGGAE